MSSEVILYQTEDGKSLVQLRAMDGTVWLSQTEIAELFATTKQNVSLHAKNILGEGELTAEATVKDSLTVQTEGQRRVQRPTLLYSLPMILAIGYRVRSPRGTQFRQWATGHLTEYLVKGFVMDDERLKNPGGWDYFDELLTRIREIRASEKRFYQKVRDLFALSAEEVDTLNRLVVIFLEQAELRARDRQTLTLDYWRQNVDRLLTLMDRPVLDHAGSISAEAMKAIAQDRYEAFDQNRRRREAMAADAEDLATLEALEKDAKRRGDAR
ncbi:MAG TPA: RhuM family protein [Holophagaceae bacterium]|nr:RhuM family protein [Holophagaceae bacterium]